MTRFLFISISAWLLGCTPTLPPRQSAAADIACIDKFKPVFKSELYDASVDVMGRHISGLILFKAMPDNSTRIVFTNEAGVKFFDFGFQPDGKFISYQVIRQLNRKLVIGTLRKDFELAMMTWVGKEKPDAYLTGNEMQFEFARKNDSDWIITDPGCNKLIRIEKGTAQKKKTEVRLYSQNRQAPDSIFINHLNFNMIIKLKRLERL